MCPLSTYKVLFSERKMFLTRVFKMLGKLKFRCILWALLWFLFLICSVAQYFVYKNVNENKSNKQIYIPGLAKQEEMSTGDKQTSNLTLQEFMNLNTDFNVSAFKESQLLSLSTLDGNKNSNLSDLSKCRNRNLKLFETSRPVTGLLSFPGSGNTWTRYLVQQITGIGTSSIYCDKTLEYRGFPFECYRRFGKTILVKSHHPQYIYLMTKLILLVRNPFDALLSFYNFRKAGHTGKVSKLVLDKAEEKEFNFSLKWYLDIIKKTVKNFKGQVFVLQYEKLKYDTATELKRLAMFLNVTVSDYDINCAVKNGGGNFKRHHGESNHTEFLRAVYDTDKLLRLHEVARQAEQLIENVYNSRFRFSFWLEKGLYRMRRLGVLFCCCSHQKKTGCNRISV